MLKFLRYFRLTLIVCCLWCAGLEVAGVTLTPRNAPWGNFCRVLTLSR